MFNFNASAFWVIFSLCLVSCGKEPEPLCGTYGLIPVADTAFNTLRMECLNPAENRVFHAYGYTEKSAGFRDLYLTEYQLADSIGNRNYRFRIYTHIRAITDSSYQTTDNNYNPYNDKVYIEFYKENGTVKEEYYTSELPQTENYFLFKKHSSSSLFTQFRYLAKASNPDRFAVISGKIRLIY